MVNLIFIYSVGIILILAGVLILTEVMPLSHENIAESKSYVSSMIVFGIWLLTPLLYPFALSFQGIAGGQPYNWAFHYETLIGTERLLFWRIWYIGIFIGIVIFLSLLVIHLLERNRTFE